MRVLKHRDVVVATESDQPPDVVLYLSRNNPVKSFTVVVDGVPHKFTDEELRRMVQKEVV